MKIYETVVTPDRKIVVENVSLMPGEKVRLLILSGKRGRRGYPLRGREVEYTNPFDSVAEEDWEALK